MIEVLTMWEEGWIPPETEAAMWRQLLAAFAVDRLMAVPKRIKVRQRIDQFDTVPEALSTAQGKVIYLTPAQTRHGDDLLHYQHPRDATYVLGRAGDNNMRHLKDVDDVVTIYSPKNVDLFGINAAAIALYDRVSKHGR